MSRAEQIQSLLDEFVPRLNALRDDALKEIGEASETARKNVDRHSRATEELGQVEAQIAALEAERESLPVEVTRANLEEDYRREDELRERYLTMRSTIDDLKGRAESLRREISSLNPLGEAHPNNITIEQYAKVASIAAGPRHELEALKDRLTKALDASIGPVVKKHESLKGTTWQLSHDLAWDQSPVGRGGIPA